MSATSPTLYRQVLLGTTDGTFAVSVAGAVELDDHGRLVSPRSIFEENSCLVAIEQEMPEAKESAREQLALPPRSKELRQGVFLLQFTEAGKVKLLPNPCKGFAKASLRSPGL